MSKQKRFHMPPIHIKSHTKGTSNELSLSVLEAARDSRSKNNQEAPSVGELDLYTVRGHKGKPKGAPKKNEALIYQSDNLIHHHKRAKRTWKSKAAPIKTSATSGFMGVAAKKSFSLGTFLIMGGIIALVVVLGIFAARFFQSETSEQAYYQNQLDSAIAAVSDTDEAFAALQVLANDLLGSHPEEEKIITDQRTRVSETLASVEDQARQASEHLKNRYDQQAAGNIVASITSRTALWNVGLALVDEATAAKAAKAAMEEGWNQTLNGDVLLKNAASEILGATKNSIETAQNSTMAARSAFEQAKTSFKEIQSVYPVYDIAPFLTYIDKRIEACDYATASNQALLDHDTEFAQEQNDSYNKADSEAVIMADTLPRDPVSTIDEAFTENIEENKKIYQTTLSQTENTDAFIRDYLGADKK